MTEAIAERYGVDLDVPWEDLPGEMRELFLTGTDERLQITYRNRYGRKRTYATRFEGIVKGLERRYRESESEGTKEKIEQFMSLRPCPVCGGARLRAESRAVLVGGTPHRPSSLRPVLARSALERLQDAEARPSLPYRMLARQILRRSTSAGSLLNVGLGHRRWTAPARRWPAARRSGSGCDADRSLLTGVPYLLDEPVSACISATLRPSARSTAARPGIRSSLSNTTRRRWPRPTSSSTWALAPASTAVRSLRRARQRRSSR